LKLNPGFSTLPRATVAGSPQKTAAVISKKPARATRAGGLLQAQIEPGENFEDFHQLVAVNVFKASNLRALERFAVVLKKLNVVSVKRVQSDMNFIRFSAPLVIETNFVFAVGYKISHADHCPKFSGAAELLDNRFDF
jgi:hypothetical protein